MPRPTEAVINLDNISRNYLFIKRRLGDAVEVFPVVKANAYGHGAVEVVKKLRTRGAGTFCVAMVEEALELIESGVTADYIILEGIFEGDAERAVRLDLKPVVFTERHVEELDSEAARQKKQVKVHIKMDTGMGRIGVDSMEIFSFVEKVSNLKNIAIDGLLSHLAVAASEDEEDKRYTADQIASFAIVKKGLLQKGYDIPWFHTANSAAVLSWPEAHHNAARPGIILYGCRPAPTFSIPEDFKEAATLRSKITFIKRVPSGTSISYGRKTTVRRSSLIATVPIGYADGLTRRVPVGFEFLVNGRRAPLTGVVTMDMIMLDVTDIHGVAVGDEVVLIGRSGDEVISVDDMAEATGTIAWEVLTSISTRARRNYIGKAED